MSELLAHAPLAPEAPSYEPQRQISPYERVRLGGDELAICSLITLDPDSENSEPLLLLDVGFRTDETGNFGPYDVDGSGTKQTFSKPYVLVRKKETSEGPKLFTYAFDDNEVVELGRGQHNDNPVAVALGYNDNRHVSRRHATITTHTSGRIEVVDNSTNGTKTESAADLIPDIRTNFGYTFGIEDYVHRAGKGAGFVSKDKEKGWGYGVYQKRNVIARDTPINSGVYPVGGTHGEAIVVDDEKYPDELNEVYDKVTNSLDNVQPHRLGLRGIQKAFGRKQVSAVVNKDEETLQNVFNVVSDTLKYDINATDAIASDYQKVAMNYYIGEGVGVCRTQALLSAYVLERLVKEGKLNGRVSVDRNQDFFEGAEAGHAWARFTNEDGTVYIIDPAQKFVGTLQAAQQNQNHWDYRRTEDAIRDILTTTNS